MNIGKGNERRTVIVERDGVITINQDETCLSEGTEVCISWGWCALFIVFVIMVIFFLLKMGGSKIVESIGGYEKPTDQGQSLTVMEEGSVDTGMLFPNSSAVLLTYDDVNKNDFVDRYSELEIIQRAINEIYARKGYHFTEAYWYDYYSNFSWYVDRGLTGEEAVKLFNEIELQNVRFLVEQRTAIRGY